MDSMDDFIDMRVLGPLLQKYGNYHPPHLLQKSDVVTHNPRMAHTGLASESLPDKPLEWLNECLSQDDLCGNLGKTSGQNSFLPSRLLDLKPNTVGDLTQGYTQKLQLIDTRHKPIDDGKYVALSHRWASHDDPRLDLTTKTDTLEARMDAIEVERLSETYRFAIDVCHWLGMRYLWIDSFCIIQDSEDDWNGESKMMAQIYRCALCTISINIPETVDKPLWTNCGYIGEEADGWVIDTVNTESWRTLSDTVWMALLEGGPLGTRAWCLQERQLSPRILHFLDPGMIMFECCYFVAALGGPIVFGIPGHSSRDRKPDHRKRLIDIDHDDGVRHKEVWRAWSRCLTDYTSRSLTFETDRPVAVQGMVDYIKAVTKSDYFYGIWKEDLYRGLLWERHASVGDRWARTPTANEEQPPTWSWLSVVGPVNDMAGNDEDHNPPIMEDKRDQRPVFDHSYQSVLGSAVVSDDRRMQILHGPVLSVLMDYESQLVTEDGMLAHGRRVGLRLGEETSHVLAWACLDVTSESYRGSVVMLAVTRSYGLLLRTMGEGDELGLGLRTIPKYQRLGTVRASRREGAYSWQLTRDFAMKSVVIV